MNEATMSDPVEQDQASTPVEKPVEKKAEPGKVKKPFSRVFNTPWAWILITAPLSGICMWLANNTWIITNNTDKPYMMLAGPATVASIVLVWFLIVFCKAIIAGIKKSATFTFEYLKKPAHRFWIGTTIFLIASILVGGQTFNEIAKENNIYGILGYAIEVAVDTASVFCILARQGAVRRGDDFGIWLYTIALLLCATFSTLANAYMVRVHYVAPASVNDPFWYAVAFALGAAPPLFIIVLSLTSDYVTDQEGTKLNPDQFDQSEKDRIRFDEIRLESLRARKQIQDQINALKGVAEKKAGPRGPRFVFNLRKPQAPDYTKIADMIAATMTQQQGVYEAKIHDLETVIKAMRDDINRQQQPVEEHKMFTHHEHLSERQDTDPLPKVFTASGHLSGRDSEHECEYNPFTDEDDEEDAFVNSFVDDFVDGRVDSPVNSKWIKSGRLSEQHSELTVDTEPSKSVHSQRTSNPRITVKLSEYHRNTDDLTPVNKKARSAKTASGISGKGDAAKRVQRILKRKPDIGLTELAERANVSRSYASQIRSQFQTEVSA